MRWMLIFYLAFLIAVAALVGSLIFKLQVKRPLRLITIILLLVASPMIFSYLMVAYYQPLPETTVPDLTGLTETDARDTLKQYNLNIKVEQKYESELITLQHPEAGRTFKQGRTILVTLGKPKIEKVKTEVLTPEAPALITPEVQEEIIIYEEVTEEGESE